jgi:histone H3/H4
MPRKVKRTPAPLVIDESEKDVKKEKPPQVSEVEKATESSEVAVKTEDLPVYSDTESPANETTKTIRRPKKKLRRPTLSDTIPAIPVASFRRLAREISQDCKFYIRWEGEALEALQVDTEAYLIEKFQQANRTLDLFGKSCKTVGEKMLRA